MSLQGFLADSLEASLTVQDLENSLAWYRDVLGFTVDRKHERGGKVIAVSLKAGAVRLLISQDDQARGRDRIKGQGMSLQLTTRENADAGATRIKRAGGVLESGWLRDLRLWALLLIPYWLLVFLMFSRLGSP